MTAFLRRFTGNPGLDVITEIEGVVLLDQEPPGQVAGTGSRAVCCVAEFENGPFNTPTELFGAQDQLSTFGELGFVYDGVPAQNPCARKRLPDSATTPSYWNGNGFLWLHGARFRRIFAVRVDTSVGTVKFTRLASVLGATTQGFVTFNLEPAQTLVLTIDGSDTTVTFDAAVATKLSADGTYNSTFAGGESITYVIDDVEYTTTFLLADQSHAQVVARLNATVGYTAFAQSTLKTSITGRRRGTAGNVRILSVSAVLVTTATGFSAGAATAGTGDVANIDTVTVAEATALVEADTTGDATLDVDVNGKLRLVNLATPGTGTIAVKSTSTALAFGFTLGEEGDAAVGLAGTIPAGTVVQNGAGVDFVTMQDIAVTAEAISGVAASGPGPYPIKVRHALDDGSGALSAIATLTVLPTPLALGAFAVTNDAAVTACLTEAQLDAAYLTAIATTIAIDKPVREVNVIAAARRSNAIRGALKTNAIDASANGCRGRVAVVSPPLGTTTRALARSTTVQPGVGAYRSDRVWYAFPGVRQFIPRIAARGLAGGTGFTADGVIDVPFDKAVASLSSCLPPEENIGQETEFLDWIVGLEANNTDVQTLTIDDYKAFKRSGIMAPNVLGVVTIQSAVTSVDPVDKPGRVQANRRAFADYLLDSMGEFSRPWSKLLATVRRRGQLVGQLNAFVQDLVRLERAEQGLVDGKSGNTPASLARGVFWIKVKVRMIPAMLDIVIDGEIGENVVVFSEQ